MFFYYFLPVRVNSADRSGRVTSKPSPCIKLQVTIFFTSRPCKLLLLLYV